MLGVSLKGDGHNGDLNVTGIFERRSFVNVCPRARENSLASRRMRLSHSVIFKLDTISPCPPLLGFGPHMSFISICRNCETFTTMDCDRFHKLNFTVALGGEEAVAHHLLIVTVPDTSIRGCLTVLRQFWYLHKKWILYFWDFIVLKVEMKKCVCERSVWVFLGHITKLFHVKVSFKVIGFCVSINLLIFRLAPVLNGLSELCCQSLHLKLHSWIF